MEESRSAPGTDGKTPKAPAPVPLALAGAPPKKKKRRWLRWLLGLVVVPLLVGFLSPLALALPPVRHAIERAIGDELDRDVEIASLSGWWWGGVEMRGLVVRDTKDMGGETFLTVERIHVDADYFKAIHGVVSASVEVVRPVATLRRAADGRRNTDDLVRDEPGRKRSKKPKDRDASVRRRRRDGGTDEWPTLSLRVVEGKLISLAPSEERRPPDTIDAIGLEVTTRPEGRLEASFHAVARGAAPSGGDASVDAKAALDEKSGGPASLEVSEVDLARLREVFGAVGVERIAGRLAVSAKVTLDGEGRPTGSVRAGVVGLSLQAEGASVSADSATLEANPAADRFPIRLAIKNLALDGLSDVGERFVEPSLSVEGTVERLGDDGLSLGTAAAPFRIEGRTLSGTASGSVTGLSGEKPTGDLRAHLVLMLSPTIGRLAGLLERADDDLRGTVTFDATVTGGGGAPAVSVEAVARDLVIGGGRGTAPLREAAVTLSAAGAWDEASRTIVLTKAGLSSEAVSVVAKDKVAVRPARGKGESATVLGQWTATADLARLQGLRALVPAVASLRGGRAAVAIDVEHDRATKIGLAARVADLSVGPNELSSRGFQTSSITFRALYERDASGETHTITIAEFKSPIAWTDAAQPPARVRIGKGSVSIVSRAEVTLDLFSLGTTFDKALGLRPTDVLAGKAVIALEGAAASGGGAPAFDVTLAGRDVVLPRAKGLAPAKLDGRVRVAGDGAGGWTLTNASLDGFGLALRGDAALTKTAKGLDVAHAHATAKGDLAAARGLLGFALSLPPAATVSGALDATADVTPEKAGRRVVGKATVRDLHYAAGGGAPALSEPSVVIEHDVTLDASPGRHAIERLALSTAAVRATAKGSVATGEGGNFDLTVDVDGDAQRLAEDLRAVLGKDYDDLAGEGRLAAHLAVSGPTESGLRDLRIGGDATLARIATGGVTITDARAKLYRASGAVPLTVTVASGLNGGTLDLAANFDLAREAIPWNARLSLRAIDTAPLVTGKGATRVLPMLLPALVPAGSATPVLSGRLDGDAELSSASAKDPALLDALTGPGSLRMTRGAIARSTLFAALAGKGKSKGLATVLKVVPGLGGALEELGRSVVFSEMTSRFTLGRRVVHIEEVRLEAEKASLRFDGTVGFDGRLALDVPVRVGGEVGKAIREVVPDSTIPLEVRGTVKSPTVEPKLKLENLGKSLLDDILRRAR